MSKANSTDVENVIETGDKVRFSAPLSNGGTATWTASVVKVEDGVAFVRHPERARTMPFSPVSVKGLYKYDAAKLIASRVKGRRAVPQGLVSGVCARCGNPAPPQTVVCDACQKVADSFNQAIRLRADVNESNWAGRPDYGNRLVTFLYLLTRDELATGVIERLLKETEKAECPVFSARHIEAQAREWAARLTTSGAANRG